MEIFGEILAKGNTTANGFVSDCFDLSVNTLFTKANNNESSLKIDDNIEFGLKTFNDSIFISLSDNLKIAEEYYIKLHDFKTEDLGIIEIQKNLFETFDSIKEKIFNSENNIFESEKIKKLKKNTAFSPGLYFLTETYTNIIKHENFQESKELNNLFNNYLEKLQKSIDNIQALINEIHLKSTSEH